MGTVTTGDPGTAASVTNSGTQQNAVFDFVIPKGDTGSTPSPQFLSAYSTPPQPATSGSSLVFDQNGLSNGTAVTHTTNSPNIVIQEPGYYSVSFHGTVSPNNDSSFPVSILLFLQQDGSSVAGTGVRQNFQSENEATNMAFTQNIQVNTVPSTLTVQNSGGSIQYGDAAITVNRIGDA